MPGSVDPAGAVGPVGRVAATKLTDRAVTKLVGNAVAIAYASGAGATAARNAPDPPIPPYFPFHLSGIRDLDLLFGDLEVHSPRVDLRARERSLARSLDGTSSQNPWSCSADRAASRCPRRARWPWPLCWACSRRHKKEIGSHDRRRHPHAPRPPTDRDAPGRGGRGRPHGTSARSMAGDHEQFACSPVCAALRLTVCPHRAPQ